MTDTNNNNCSNDNTVVPLYFSIKHTSNTYNVTVDNNATIAMLKHQISLLTNIEIQNQKLIIRKIKTKFDNDTVLSTLFNDVTTTSDNPIRMMLLGTPSSTLKHMHIEAHKHIELNKFILDDFDLPDTQYDNITSKLLLQNHKIQHKLQKAITAAEINFINPSRPNKKLLVLDIDYTIFDMKATTYDVNKLKRPYTDYMLTTLYQYYDICFWVCYMYMYKCVNNNCSTSIN